MATFNLSEISEQLKDVSRQWIGVSFAGKGLVLDTANDGKMSENFWMIFLKVF